jgi:hypothetical protein
MLAIIGIALGTLLLIVAIIPNPPTKECMNRLCQQYEGFNYSANVKDTLFCESCKQGLCEIKEFRMVDNPC